MADIQGSNRGLLLGALVVAAAVLVFVIYRPDGKKNVIEKGLDAKELAAEAQTRANLQGLETAVVTYMADAGGAPSSLAALQNLRLLPGGAIDGWGRTIRYERISDSSFRVISAGKDGSFGTGDDIVREY